MLQAEVSSEAAEALTRQLGLRFYRACVKDNLNVSEGNHLTCIVFVLSMVTQHAVTLSVAAVGSLLVLQQTMCMP